MLAVLEQDMALAEIPSKNADYTDVFSPDLVIELPKHTGFNKHAIELVEHKQPP